MKRIEEIKKALQELGYCKNTHIRVTLYETTALVVVNDKIIGIYDFNKHTFTD